MTMMFFRTAGYLTRFDLYLLHAVLRTRHSPGLMAFFRRVSRSGDGYFYIVALCFGLVNQTLVYQHYVFSLVLGLLLERPLYLIFKNTIKRDRPFRVVPGVESLVVPGDCFSFPSGHTSASFMFTVISAAAYPALLPLLLPLSLLVGASRVVLGVHYPSDILAGAVLGASVGSVVSSLFLAL